MNPPDEYRGKLVGHGTRHTASTLLREHNWPKDHVEAQLAHVEDGIAGIYNKARYIPQRAVMMQWYSLASGSREASTVSARGRRLMSARFIFVWFR
jgi:integrase